eukprot:g34596.t1
MSRCSLPFSQLHSEIQPNFRRIFKFSWGSKCGFATTWDKGSERKVGNGLSLCISMRVSLPSPALTHASYAR